MISEKSVLNHFNLVEKKNNFKICDILRVKHLKFKTSQGNNWCGTLGIELVTPYIAN